MHLTKRVFQRKNGIGDKRKGENYLERYYKEFKRVRTQVNADIDEELLKLMFLDNIEHIGALREMKYHYELADEGSTGSTLKVLTDAVEKHLDQRLRERNREAEVRAGGSAQSIPGMTASEEKPKSRKKKRKALAASVKDDSAASADHAKETHDVASESGANI